VSPASDIQLAPDGWHIGTGFIFTVGEEAVVESSREESVMRIAVIASVLGAVALAFSAVSSEPASAAKTKKGCVIGSQTWNAVEGKCVARTAKAKAKAKKAMAAKKAPAKK
jgi:hypothetical protein